MSDSIDTEQLRLWVGREATSRDRITPRLVDSVAATLEIEPGAVPDFAHWCLFPPVAPTSSLGADGHPATGRFLPPVPLPRRMWAGGSLTRISPLPTDCELVKRSVIADVQVKHGRSGTLCFVTIAHEYQAEGQICATERQDLVYREASSAETKPVAPAPAPAALPPYQISREMIPSPAFLFRYSALTFNSHRIHYDLPYARDIEGYPALVVHGPLQATQLGLLAAELLGRPPRDFTFRGVTPILCDDRYSVEAQRGSEGLMLRTVQRGRAGMEALAT